MDVEQRLRSAGERWRAEQATQGFDLDAERLLSTAKRRRVPTWVPPLGAVAVVLLLAGVVVAGRAGVFASSGGAAPSGQNSASYPAWRPAEPPPRCTATQMALSLGRVVTKGSRQYTQIVLRNVDVTPCVLDSVLPLQGVSPTDKVTPLRFPEDASRAFPGTNGTSIIAFRAAGDFWVTTDRTCTQLRSFVSLRVEFGPSDWVEMSFPPHLRHGCLVAESGAGISGAVNP